MPNLHVHEWTTPEGQLWLGRATALVEAVSGIADTAAITVASNNLGNDSTHYGNVQTIKAAVYRAFARAEMEAPASMQGSFLPVGEPFTAISTVAKLLREATHSALFVDPYADANLLTDYAILAPEQVTVRVLTNRNFKPALKPAATAWTFQHGTVRPLEVRLAAAGRLHDRLIAIDDRKVWSVGQSFNALAARSPTAILLVDADARELKLSAYSAIWNDATPLE